MTKSAHGFDPIATDVVPESVGAAHPVRAQAELTWTDARGPHRFLLGGRAAAGSADANEVVIADRATSRLHAELSVREGAVWVRDLGSRNGTFVDALQVIEARISDGSRVRLGMVEVAVRYDVERAAVDLWPSAQLGPLLGRSVAMRECFSRIDRIAKDDATVLVQGETGTGKELVARTIHDCSPRAKGPFVIVDCGALPENLLESELFGHAQGAFTGAVRARAGAFECAEGGTVFLDEIGELPLAMQPKLLRVLESRTVRRLGEAHPRAVDVRIVSATHRDLRTMVNLGAFREDLYFRLAVLPLLVPPLRERPEDVALLAQSFLPAGEVLGPDFVRQLGSQPWVGNVRELRNLVARARVLGSSEALSAAPLSRGGRASESFPPVDPEESFHEIRARWLDHLEREYVKKLLALHHGNVSAVGKAAGLDRTYIYRLMRKHDL